MVVPLPFNKMKKELISIPRAIQIKCPGTSEQ